MRPQAHRQVGFYGIGGGSDASQAVEAGSGERRSLGAFAFNPVSQPLPPRPLVIPAISLLVNPSILLRHSGERRNPERLPTANPRFFKTRLRSSPSDLRCQLPHVRQVAIRSIVVESIADHEYVRHVEPGVVYFHAIHSAGWLVEQGAYADGFRA